MKESGLGRFFSAKNIALLGVLMALVIILQSIALVTGLVLPTSLSFVLIPIVLGAVIMGPLAGGILGFLFGLVVVVFGAFSWDKFTFLLLSEQPWLTILTCFVKGIAAGVVPAFVYRLIAKRNRYVALVVAALLAPIMNTGFFVLGAMTMWGLFSDLAAANGQNILYYIIVTCALINFSIEFGSTVIAAPSIYRVTEVVLAKKGKKPLAKKNGEQVPQEIET